jgi:hypothetical protein
MEITPELVSLCAVVILTVGLLLWFILAFVPSMLNLKDSHDRRD